MKRILFPTDFSPHAQNALNYAIEVAKVFNSTIHLLHTYHVHSSADMLISIERYIRDDAEKMMKDNINWIHKQWPEHPPVTHQIIRGNAIPLIAGIADDYDLVIMGTQGASRLKGIFLGSTTNGVGKSTETPVLAIPTNANYRPIKNIVLAIDDFEVTNKEVLEPLARFVNRYKASLKIFHSSIGPTDLGVDPIIGKYLAKVDYSLHNAPVSRRINDSIRDFLSENPADILCMIGRKRAKLNEIFHKSVTKREVLHTEIPLLILTDKAIITDF